MYDDPDDIPDSDSKIFMSLDDIIRMEGIKVPPRPGSVRSMATHRSNYSNFSRRSTYSNRSRRSTYTNTSRCSNYSNKSRRSNYSNKSRRSNYSNKSRRSNYSNKSRRSNYSNKSQLYRFSVQPFNQRNIGGHFIRRFGVNHKNETAAQYKILKRPGVYVPNNKITFYKNKVRQAVKTLRGPVSRNKYIGLRRNFYNGQIKRLPFSNARYIAHLRYRNNMHIPQNIQVAVVNDKGIWPSMNRTSNNMAISNVNRSPRLTRKTLALFNKINNKTQLNGYRQNTPSMYSSQMSSCRHSVRASLNSKLQKEIQAVQRKAQQSTNVKHQDMDFVPTPAVTKRLISERFSSYD